MPHKALPGRLIGGRYRLIEKLGSGGFGRIWKAHDETLGIDVAVKEVWLPPAMSDVEHADRLTRAKREARNAVRLRDHPNIVTVHDMAIEDGVPWTVMQLVAGSSLEDHIAARGPLPVAEAIRVATCLLDALRVAHAEGIVHRDVKPANVMLATTGEVLLTDFGIAVHQADTALTATGMLIGSMEYTAPERLNGQRGEAASDLFSLGATLYQAVEGVSPFRRDTPAGTLTAVLHDQPSPPRHAGELAELITRLLEKDPDKRPAVPEALALIDAPVAVTQPASASRGRPASRPQPETKVQPAKPAKMGTWDWLVVPSLLVLVAVYHLGWGRSASDAETGDCVYMKGQKLLIEPCGWPLRGEIRYKVLLRLDGPSDVARQCPGEAPGWKDGDYTWHWPAKSVLLCLSPRH